MTARFAVDSSALIAILNHEPKAAEFAAALNGAKVLIGWPTALEVRIWLLRRPPEVAAWFDALLADGDTITVPFGREHEQMASEAMARFGKGHNPASLNFGDCMAYAVAAVEDVPLLFKGADFGKTDITIHPASVIL